MSMDHLGKRKIISLLNWCEQESNFSSQNLEKLFLFLVGDAIFILLFSIAISYKFNIVASLKC